MSHPFQFGFKSGSSTPLCTGIVKCIVSKYLHNGSSVLGCFLDASKAFDMVDHRIIGKERSSIPDPSLSSFLVLYSRDESSLFISRIQFI